MSPAMLPTNISPAPCGANDNVQLAAQAAEDRDTQLDDFAAIIAALAAQCAFTPTAQVAEDVPANAAASNIDAAGLAAPADALAPTPTPVQAMTLTPDMTAGVVGSDGQGAFDMPAAVPPAAPSEGFVAFAITNARATAATSHDRFAPAPDEIIAGDAAIDIFAASPRDLLAAVRAALHADTASGGAQNNTPGNSDEPPASGSQVTDAAEARTALASAAAPDLSVNRGAAPDADARSIFAQTLAQVIRTGENLQPRETRRVRLELAPEHLGRVEITVARGDDGRITAHLRADADHAYRALTDQMPELRRALEDAGLAVARLDASAATGFDSTADPRRDPSSQQQQQPARRAHEDLPAQPAPIAETATRGSASARLLSVQA